MREIWKPVLDFEGVYEVSNCGDIRRLAVQGKKGTGNYLRAEHLVKSRENNKGYPMVDLWMNGKRKQKLVHRLVAEAFIPNPQNLPEVNHKDENPANCNADNLEWCDRIYNMNYGSCAKRIGKANGKPVFQFDLHGNLLRRYESTMQAQRETGICNARISESCTGKREKGGGFIWRYAK